MRELLIVKNKLSNNYVVYDGIHREDHRSEYDAIQALLQDLQNKAKFHLNPNKKLGICLKDFDSEAEHKIKQNLESRFKVKYLDKLSKVPKPIPLRDY